MSSSNKSRRLLALLYILHKHDRITRRDLLAHHELARHYGPSADRMLRRDLADLAGRPFKALPGPGLPPLTNLMSYAWDIRYDAATTCVSLASSRLGALHEGEVSLLGAIEKSVRDDPLLGTQLREMLARLGYGGVHISAPVLALDVATDYQPHLQTLQRIVEAEREGRAVNFDYRLRSAEVAAFVEVDVAGLELRGGHYYLYGTPAKTGDERQFRVDRIVPGSLAFHPRYGQARPRRSSVEVQVRYWLAPELSDRDISRRLRDQQTESADDGGVIVSGKARSLFDVERLLLSYGPLARALDPPELCRSMAENARAMALLYDGSPNLLLD